MARKSRTKVGVTPGGRAYRSVVGASGRITDVRGKSNVLYTKLTTPTHSTKEKSQPYDPDSFKKIKKGPTKPLKNKLKKPGNRL